MRCLLPILLTIGCLVMDHVFLAEMERENHHKAVRLKGVASLCFVLIGLYFTLISPDRGRAVLVLFGLVLGMIGDILLAMRYEFPERHDSYFLIGAISFAIGHLFYLAALIGLQTKALLWGLPFWVVGLGLSAFYAFKKKSDAGPMQIPGYGYIALVVAMGAVACGLAAGRPCTATVLFALGGILFVVSDNILAAHCFGTAKAPVYNRWVHYTYYAAQLLIAWSLAFVVRGI